jgi:hypothetical protein
MNATIPFQAWKCLITDEMLGNIVHRTIQYILVIQANFSRENSAEFRDRIAIKIFIGFMFLAGALRSKRVWKSFGVLTEMTLKAFA